jgi:peptidyl-tRNA hydrolase
MAAASSSSSLVQYVVVRGDLLARLAWPVGALVAQACHAATAVIHLHYQDANTQLYLADLDNMHKVVLEAPDEESLRDLARKLAESGVDHKLWVEQPEDFPTCLAVKPYPKSEVQRHFKKLKLYKGPKMD